MMETMLVMPIMLMIGFGIVHAGLVYQAKSNLEYAALMAARVGASSSINIQDMLNEVEFRLRPTTGLDGSDPDSVEDVRSDIRIEVLNPSYSMFQACGRQPSNNLLDCALPTICEIPHFGLQYLDRNDPLNDCAGAPIQDANILRIRVVYTYDSKVPFLNRIRLVGESARPEAEGMDISAVATVRMQTPARFTLGNQNHFVDSP